MVSEFTFIKDSILNVYKFRPSSEMLVTRTVSGFRAQLQDSIHRYSSLLRYCGELVGLCTSLTCAPVTVAHAGAEWHRDPVQRQSWGGCGKTCVTAPNVGFGRIQAVAVGREYDLHIDHLAF